MTDPRAGGSFSADGVFQIAWDSTSLDTYCQCPRKYLLSIREGWRPKIGDATLLYGQCRHAAHEAYAKARALGQSREDALDRAVQIALEQSWEPQNLDDLAALGPKDARNKRTRANLVRSVVWWDDEFGDDDTVQTIVLPDGRVAAELSWTLPLPIMAPDGSTYLLCGHFDRLVTFCGSNYVGEFKTTTSALSGFYFARYSPNTQVSNYTFAGQTLLPDGVKGVLIEAEQVGVGFSRFERHYAHRSRQEVSEWFDTACEWIKRAELDASKLAVGDPSAFPMNQSACGNYGGCKFRGICSKAPSVRQGSLEADFKREFWDPLKTRGD